MKEETNEEIFRASGELREFIDNNLNSENTDLPAHAGIRTNKEKLSFLSMVSEAYDPSLHPELPASFKNTKIGKTLISNVKTEMASKAVKEGDISQMKFLVGMNNYDNDASGIHTLINLRQKLGQDAYVGYLFGHMGNGKTDFAALLMEISAKEMGYEIATNVKSLYEENEEVTDYIYNFGDLMKWLTGGHAVTDLEEAEQLRKDGEIDAGDKIFLLDEGSNFASGYAGDAYDAQEKLGKLVKLIRKFGGNLLIIGHTGKDVHPDIRRLANDCIHKTGTKTAKFYESVEEASGKGLKETISSIPKTNLTYETLEISLWDWSEVPLSEKEGTGNQIVTTQNKDKRNMEMAKAYVSDSHPDLEPNEEGKITMEMLGDHYGISRQRVSQILEEIKEEANNLKSNGVKA